MSMAVSFSDFLLGDDDDDKQSCFAGDETCCLLVGELTGEGDILLLILMILLKFEINNQERPFFFSGQEMSEEAHLDKE
jgi:hypothetical protein